MTKKRSGEPRSSCPINIALELFGDRWSLLIIRDLMFKGADRYLDLLASPEKIATNILADRLARLEAVGVIDKRDDPADARRRRYRLTERGLGLAPMLIELILWTDRHFETAAPEAMIWRFRQERGEVLAELRAQWEASGSAL